MPRFKLSLLLKDIRFWILLFLVIRLYGISFPPLETGHNWRQSIVAMVARNFLEEGANILFPRVDMAGDAPGFAGMEFPLLNYLIYLVAELFGWEHWYGRAINLFVSSLGVFYFYRILQKVFNPNLAFNATLVLLVSIWFSYSRKIMPDAFALSLVIIAFYHGLRALEKQRELRHVLAYGILGTLGVLSKIPAGFLFVLFIPFFFRSHYSRRRRKLLALVSTMMTLPVLAWYFYWVPHLNELYGQWSFPMSRSFEQGFFEVLDHAPKVFKHFYSSAVKYIAFFCFLAGIGWALYRKERKVLLALALGIPAFALFIVKAGVQFAKHDYYVMPFVPLMAMVVGYLLDRIRIRWLALLLLTGILIEGVLNRWHTIHLDEKHRELIHLEADLRKVSDRKDLIMVNSGRNPTPLYFAHREGWLVRNEQLRKASFLKQKMEEGCRYLLILKRSFTEPIQPPIGQMVLNDPSYAIYRLPRNG